MSTKTRLVRSFTVSSAAPETKLIAGALIRLAAEHGAPNGFQCWEVSEHTGLSHLVVGRFASQRINELQLEVTRREPSLHLAGYEPTSGFKQRLFRLERNCASAPGKVSHGIR